MIPRGKSLLTYIVAFFGITFILGIAFVLYMMNAHLIRAATSDAKLAKQDRFTFYQNNASQPAELQEWSNHLVKHPSESCEVTEIRVDPTTATVHDADIYDPPEGWRFGYRYSCSDKSLYFLHGDPAEVWIVQAGESLADAEIRPFLDESFVKDLSRRGYQGYHEIKGLNNHLLGVVLNESKIGS